MKPLYESVKKEKSQADKMFEELGYKKITDNDKEIIYKYTETLMGDMIEHIIKFAKVGKIIFSYESNNKFQCVGLDKEGLKAINQKCKELEWLDE